MRNSLITLTGSRVNRKNIMVLPSALFNGFEKARHGAPSMYNHDHHRPLGWMLPKALVFDCDNTRLMGRIVIPSSDTEENRIMELVGGYLDSHLVPDDIQKGKLIELLSSKIKDCVEIYNIGQATVALGDKIVRLEYPELFKDEDDDGLISCKKLQYIGSGVFKYKKVLVFASRNFRRSLSIYNNFNEEFLDYYFKLTGNFEKKIAIDDSTIGLTDSLLMPVELDYWWGPKFEDDIMSIPNGMTRHTATSHGLNIILGIDFTDFRWYLNKEKKKVFECEEVLNIPSMGIGIDKYGCKYCHAIFSDSDTCEHMDGAIRIYNNDEIEERKSSDLIKTEKHTVYKKMWRIDGNIGKDIFLGLAHYNFRSNTLLSEYFNEKNAAQESTLHAETKDSFETENSYTPKLIGEFNTILASCGFINKEITRQEEIHFEYQLDIEGNKFSDFCIIDLQKILRKNGNHYSEDKYEIVAYEDVIHNIPIIYHLGTNSFKNAQTTCKRIKEYIELWKDKTDDRLISFTIACEIGKDDFVFFSFCGDFGNMHKMMLDIQIIPNSHAEICTYCDKLDDYLSKKSETFARSHTYEYFVLDNGALYFPRTFFPGYSVYNDSSPPSFHFTEKPEKDIAFASIVYDARCSNCGKNYCQCGCIAREQTSQINMLKPELVGFFHTDRRAFRSPE